jgi:hypothetical protein
MLPSCPGQPQHDLHNADHDDDPERMFGRHRGEIATSCSAPRISSAAPASVTAPPKIAVRQPSAFAQRCQRNSEGAEAPINADVAAEIKPGMMGSRIRYAP